MIYTENAISAAKYAAKAWEAAAFAMENAKLAETLQNPSYIAITVRAAELNAGAASEAWKLINGCYEDGCSCDTYEAIEIACGAASDAEDMARDAVKYATSLLEKANA